MQNDHRKKESDLKELCLFFAEICCNLCRFQHLSEDGISPEHIRISQEVYLGVPGAFADIKVQIPGSSAYFIEIKYGYSRQKLIRSLCRKYSKDTPGLENASKLILLIDNELFRDWPEIEPEIQPHIRDSLRLELWSEAQLLSRISKIFDVSINAFSETDISALRSAMDKAKGVYAFGDEWANDSLQLSLLWHFGFWRLKQLRERGFVSREIIKPGLYKNVVIVMADFCSFSSYVRDTRDDEVVRYCLTSFYSKARYEILNNGGMMYQFVGDQVIGLFGFPTQTSDYLKEALECAKNLADIGTSVSHEWQRLIDRVQNSKGVHVGMAMGDVQIVYLRPCGRTRIGAVSDSVNMAARILNYASSGEIVVSNTYYQGLDEVTQADFEELEGIDARNIGKINAWKLRLHK